MSETTQEPLDRKDLKIMGLQQRLAELDEKHLELQVDYTIVVQQLQQLQQNQADSEAAPVEAPADADEDSAVL
jgi:hypothetical protein